MSTEPQDQIGEGQEPRVEQDDTSKAAIEQDSYQRAMEYARPYMATGRTLEEALDAIRADGFDPDIDLPPQELRVDVG